MGDGSFWGATRMIKPGQRRREVPGVEALEGRALLSEFGVERPRVAGAAILARVPRPKFSYPAAGRNAVINALLGGAGSEFVKLMLREAKNPLGVVAGFSNHT